MTTNHTNNKIKTFSQCSWFEISSPYRAYMGTIVKALLNKPTSILIPGFAFPCINGRRVIHQSPSLNLFCSHILAKRVGEVLFLPRELTLEIQSYPGFIAENLFIFFYMTLFKQKSRCHCFYFAILLHF